MDKHPLILLLLLLTGWLKYGECQVTEKSFGSDCSDGRFDLVVVLDGSGSICESVPTFRPGQDKTCSNWKLIIQFLIDLSDSLPLENGVARMGLVLFNDQVKIRFTLDRYTYIDDIRQAILDLDFDTSRDRSYHVPWGQSNHAGAIQIAASQVFGQTSGDRPSATNVMLVITDGETSAAYRTDMYEQAEAAKAAGIIILVIGITGSINVRTIQRLSSPPKVENITYFISKDFSGLHSTLLGVLSARRKMCSTTARTSVSTVPTNALSDTERGDDTKLTSTASHSAQSPHITTPNTPPNTSDWTLSQDMSTNPYTTSGINPLLGAQAAASRQSGSCKNRDLLTALILLGILVAALLFLLIVMIHLYLRCCCSCWFQCFALCGCRGRVDEETQTFQLYCYMDKGTQAYMPEESVPSGCQSERDSGLDVVINRDDNTIAISGKKIEVKLDQHTREVDHNWRSMKVNRRNCRTLPTYLPCHRSGPTDYLSRLLGQERKDVSSTRSNSSDTVHSTSEHSQHALSRNGRSSRSSILPPKYLTRRLKPAPSNTNAVHPLRQKDVWSPPASVIFRETKDMFIVQINGKNYPVDKRERRFDSPK